MQHRWKKLLFISVHANLKKIKNSVSKEIVVTLCTLVLLGLFYYIFSDFLNGQIKRISTRMRDFSAILLLLVLIIASSAFIGKAFYNELLKERSLALFAKGIGEDSKQLNFFIVGRVFITLMLFLPCFFTVANQALLPVTPLNALSQLLLLLCFSALFFLKYKNEKARELKTSLIPFKISDNRQNAIITWHWRLLCYRNKSAQFHLASAALLAALSLMPLGNAYNWLWNFFCAFLTGFFTALALVNQISKDIEDSLFEKSLGVSHEEYYHTIQTICLRLALFSGFATAIPALRLVEGHSAESYIIAGKLVFIAALGPCLVPACMFQIDPRKTLVQALSVFITALFLSTAIMAHFAAIALLPFVVYYARTTQLNRYYRA